MGIDITINFGNSRNFFQSMPADADRGTDSSASKWDIPLERGASGGDINERDSSNPVQQLLNDKSSPLGQLLSALVNALQDLFKSRNDDQEGNLSRQQGAATGSPLEAPGPLPSSSPSSSSAPSLSPVSSSSPSRSTGSQPANFESYEVPGLGANKQKIVCAAQKHGATAEETATCLAIANLETDNMDSNYQYGDGKTGDAANYSLYKMNKAQLREIDKNVDADSLNRDPARATELMIDGMRKFGMDNFINFHRGGASGLNGRMDESVMQPYRDGINNLKNAYLSDQNLWHDDRRVKQTVGAI